MEEYIDGLNGNHQPRLSLPQLATEHQALRASVEGLEHQLSTIAEDLTTTKSAVMMVTGVLQSSEAYLLPCFQEMERRLGERLDKLLEAQVAFTRRLDRLEDTVKGQGDAWYNGAGPSTQGGQMHSQEPQSNAIVPAASEPKRTMNGSAIATITNQSIVRNLNELQLPERYEIQTMKEGVPFSVKDVYDEWEHGYPPGSGIPLRKVAETAAANKSYKPFGDGKDPHYKKWQRHKRVIYAVEAKSKEFQQKLPWLEREKAITLAVSYWESVRVLEMKGSMYNLREALAEPKDDENKRKMQLQLAGEEKQGTKRKNESEKLRGRLHAANLRLSEFLHDNGY